MKLFFSAGETSGDQHASNLIAELRRQAPDIEVRGLGGDRMTAAGMSCDYNMVQRSVMWLHALQRIPDMRRVLRNTAEIFETDPPDAVVLVDSVGFNLYVAREAKRRGIPVLYYISPQLWAHGSWRVKKLRKFVDKVLVIYPFEVDFYTQHGMPAAYVGHPLFDELINKPLDDALIERLKPGQGKRLVALLPGSRRQEIRDLMPIMVRASHQLAERVGDLEFCIACAGPEHEERIKGILAETGADIPIEVGHPSEVISASDLCLASSGTATLQVAYFRKPMVIVYQVSPLFYFFAKPFVSTPFIGLANVLSGKEVVPEFVLTRPRHEPVATAAEKFLTDRERYDACVRDLTELRDRVAQPGASANAAREILAFLAKE